MPLSGAGLILTICGAAAAVGFLGGLLQHWAMALRSRSAACRDENRVWPAPPSDVELAAMGGCGRSALWVDGEVAIRGPGMSDAELMAIRGGM